ncbi:hypothetical protein [Brevundimonas sp.]|uniref:hypothetical protein n=1 Tax=Brevundimonas sp. TaxID=1871086 RepID=UPI002D604AD7|nr:hypothetical protein [Brevundimonas sp.]HYC99219.1 hypothetical protein [Brevundimonas sp.]
MLISILVSLMVIAGTAQADTNPRFDLICEGTQRLSNPMLGVLKESPWSQRIAVDMDLELFCNEGCTAPSRIARVTADAIHFAISEKPEVVTVVAVADGQFYHTQIGEVQGNRYVETMVGSCRKADFTPFPQSSF